MTVVHLWDSAEPLDSVVLTLSMVALLIILGQWLVSSTLQFIRRRRVSRELNEAE